jgi:hypothetical protein
VNPIKQVKKTLIYAGSVNGFKATDFHRCCDNQGPTLTIIKATDNKIFGGYTSLNWESSGGYNYKSDSNAYLFSVDTSQKYPVTQPSSAIFCYSGYGPTFGSHDIHISDNSNTNSGSYVQGANSYG